MYYLEVALPIAFAGETFTYTYSGEGTPPGVGVQVVVPLGQRQKVGVVLAVHQIDPGLSSLKEIISVVDPLPILTPSQISLMRWVASYYLTPIGLVLKNYLPKAIRTGLYQPPTQKAYRLTQGFDLERVTISLAKKKAASRALDTFLGAVSESDYFSAVSNKTLCSLNISSTGLRQLVSLGVLREVSVPRLRYSSSRAISQRTYDPSVLSASSKIFSEGRPSLVYVRDSSLQLDLIRSLVEATSQRGLLSLVVAPDSFRASYLAEALGDSLEVVEHHSRVSSSTRNQNYYRLLRNPESLDVVVGTRGSLMLPFGDLGLVLVLQQEDYGHKEHEKSPRINGRDLAMILASQFGATTALTTNSPSLESYSMCRYGRWARVDLGERQDVRVKLLEKGKNSLFSRYMIGQITSALERGERVLVFQNRRGFASSLYCNDCGYTPVCSRCNVSLTLHRSSGTMQCHYCGFTTSLVSTCQGCGSTNVSFQGMGTERIVEDLASLFPLALISRFDSDTVSALGEISRADIVVGTQLVLGSLGLDQFSLVVVVNSDNLFLSTDFRTSERSMISLLRLRGLVSLGGELILQSWHISHPVLKALEWDQINDYYERELDDRRGLGYPPFVRLILVRLYSRGRGQLISWASELDSLLAEALGEFVSPPYEPVVDRVEDRYILEIMVRLPRDGSLASRKGVLLDILTTFSRGYSALDLVWDVDPL